MLRCMRGKHASSEIAGCYGMKRPPRTEPASISLQAVVMLGWRQQMPLVAPSVETHQH